MRILFLGSGAFAIPCFEALLDAGHEVAVLVTANAIVTLVRFLALRLWVFRSRRAAPERISMS